MGSSTSGNMQACPQCRIVLDNVRIQYSIMSAAWNPAYIRFPGKEQRLPESMPEAEHTCKVAHRASQGPNYINKTPDKMPKRPLRNKNMQRWHDIHILLLHIITH